MQFLVSAGTVLMAAVLPLAAPVSAQVIYVDQDAAGPVHDGTSWCTAFRQLHEGLAAAPAGAMIEVADGLYLPDVTGLPDPRTATFVIAPGLTIVGGYAGCGAPNPDERDPLTHVTVLSGDLDGDDAGGGFDDNAYHVITAEAMAAATTLSGFVILGGNSGDSGSGGGILAPGGRLVLMICTLRENRAWRGGAIYVEGGELHLFQCRFLANRTTGEGGAIFDATSALDAHNCLFALNEAGNDGGAIFCDLSSADFSSCSFGGNRSQGRGGAIYDYVGVETRVGNSIVWGNTDLTGSGESAQIFLNPSNLLTIDYSCVQGWSGGYGGEGNIGDDPLFRDLPLGDLHLVSGSPCINHGSNALVGSQLDLDGNPRIVGGVVDMGCFEFQGATGLPVVATAAEAPRILSVYGFRGAAAGIVRFVPPPQGSWSLALYDALGRGVRVLARGVGASGVREVRWDGRDEAGSRVPAGVYFFALAGEGRRLDARKAVTLR